MNPLSLLPALWPGHLSWSVPALARALPSQGFLRNKDKPSTAAQREPWRLPIPEAAQSDSSPVDYQRWEVRSAPLFPPSSSLFLAPAQVYTYTP